MTGYQHTKLRDLIERFGPDTRGTTAILFTLIAVPVFGLGLASLDFSRAQGAKSAIQNAADAAAGAGARMLGAPHTEIEDAVRGFLRTNLPADRRDQSFVLTFAPDDTSLTIKMDTSVPTSILGIVGVSELAVHVETTVERPPLIGERPPRHRGVAPELPEEMVKAFPGISQSVPPETLRNVEAQAQEILRQLEKGGRAADVQRLLQGLRHLR